MIDFVGIPEVRLKKLRRSRKDIKQLEELSEASISVRDSVEIDCENPLKMLALKNVLKAFGRGFDMEDALYLLDDSYELSIIEASEFAKSSNRISEIKGRVIGRAGKTKNIIEKLTDVKISIYGKTISIIGLWENVQLANKAVCMLLEGSKHGVVYKFLEENIKRMSTN